MREQDCTAVLLPDQTWHEVEPGSMFSNPVSLAFTDAESGERYSLAQEHVLALRGREPTLPALQRA